MITSPVTDFRKQDTQPQSRGKAGLYLFIPITVFVTILLRPSAALARWAGPNDALVASDFSTQVIVVRADGTYTDTAEAQTEILKENARSGWGARRFTYNARAETFKVLFAETQIGDRKIPVDSHFIEDKPIASSGEGFDQNNQVLIAFPNVQVGAKVHFKVVEDVKEIPIPGVYSRKFTFDPNELYRNVEIQINSEIPLFVEVSDPRKCIALKQEKIDGHFQVKIKLTRDLIENAVDETEPLLNSKDKTWIVVSTAKKYAELVAPVADSYEAILSSQLPDLFQAIASKASARSTPIDQINEVTSSLATAMRYLGDWRPVKGGYIPRSLEMIAKTRFGDCKDFSAATASILRHLGFKANIAWVERTLQPTPIPKLPLTAFNHAIVRASIGDRSFWIDPTNLQSFAQGIFPDIMGRSALVVSKETADVEQIPNGTAEGSSYQDKLDVNFDANGEVITHFSHHVSGRKALAVTGASLSLSKATLDHSLLELFTKEARRQKYHVDDYDLSSRIVQDQTVTAEAVERDVAFQTSAGLAYGLSAPGWLNKIIDLEVKERVSDFSNGDPIAIERVVKLNNIQVVGSELRGCNLSSPWLTIRRSFASKGDSITVRDSYKDRATIISNADLKTQKFAQFQRQLKACFDQVAVIFKSLPQKRDGARALAGSGPRPRKGDR